MPTGSPLSDAIKVQFYGNMIVGKAYTAKLQ